MKRTSKVIAGYAILSAILINSCRTDISHPMPPQLFNDNWQFILSADSSDIFNPDSQLAWEKVRLPHTPVIEPLVVNDQWQGICWYRKDFILPPEVKGKNLFLRFEGAMNVADVWINGVKKITHLGGYLPFVIDFTSEALPGKLNRIVVRLDNMDNAITGPKPLKQLDFNTYGGLYRDVFLVMENDVFITDPICENIPGSGGIFVSYPGVSSEKAEIHVQTHIKNTGTGDEKITVQHHILQPGETGLGNGNRVGNGNRAGNGPGRDAKFCVSTGVIAIVGSRSDVTIELPSPQLWSPSSPNLYYLVTDVYNDGQLSDSDTTRIGIRRFEITKDHFAINGEEIFLRGVNRHQEYPYIGYALSNNAQYRDARLIKEAGFDYVRLSHYPHSPAFMDACDEIGLVVLDAIPGWQYYNDDPAFQDQVVRTCRDMIRRDRNHACVMAWEVSLNESWMPEAFIDRAVAAAREEFPGDQCYTAGWQKYGYDIYLQARQHRLEHYEDPGKPYIVSEYGDWEYYALNAGFAQNQWQDLLPDERTSRQSLGTGEKRLLQQATNIQEAHNDNFNTPAFADGYWSMFDYNRGYADDIESSGIMSIFRVPKFSYYFFKSQRDPDEISSNYVSGPMIKIASLWNELSGTEVRVYSNCEEVELTLNGEIISRLQPDTGRICNNLSHPPFTFRIDKFFPGKLIASGYVDGKLLASDTVTTPGTPAAIRLVMDESGRPPKAGVNDAILLYAIIVDKDGNEVPVNDVDVRIAVAGDAVVINPGNLGITEAGIATALIQIGTTAGEIEVSAEAEGLATGSIKILSY